MNPFRTIKRPRQAKLLLAALWILSPLASISPLWSQDDVSQATHPIAEPTVELQERWEYFVPVRVPAAESNVATEGTPALVDLILTPDVFSHARTDLADLRLYGLGGKSIPYALRVLRPEAAREPVPANEFNRTEPEAAFQGLTLDLQRDDIQHNEIQIVTNGVDFRRAVQVEGSDDGKTWRRLVTGHLIRFLQGNQRFNLDSFTYPDSRVRYVRVQVQPDPNAGSANEGRDQFRISDVNVLRHVEVPGERLTLDATLNPRQPVRVYGSPGSSWIIDLGGDHVPCDRLEVEVADVEFARNFSVEAEFPSGPQGKARFSPINLNGEPSWQRKLGDPKKPMVATFTNEVQTRRLKLQVTDYRNPPLDIRSIKFSAPARQVVFARLANDAGELQLYFGNPHADLPNYDFARNLSVKISPPPNRTTLGETERNPNFVPPPQPFTERLPWLIYVVLGSVTVVLALVIVSLSRTAIAIHDATNKEDPVANVG